MSRAAENPRSHHIAVMPDAEQGPRQPLSGAERTKAYRERLKAKGAERADRPPCLLCGRPILLSQIDPNSARGQSRTGRALCATCWRKSEEGRASERERDRARERAPRG